MGHGARGYFAGSVSHNLFGANRTHIRRASNNSSFVIEPAFGDLLAPLCYASVDPLGRPITCSSSLRKRLLSSPSAVFLCRDSARIDKS